ncbi:MAG: hypothetical protein J6W64_01815 [Bacilli bacterium]|nr:hypothetical protein [Bacilli bacterium]
MLFKKYCIKKSKRGIDNLFINFDCKKCPNYLNDEVIKIGNKSIYIYYLENRCKYNKSSIIYNKKSKLIFKDIYIDQVINQNYKNIFLWLDKKDTLNRYYDYFNSLMEDGYHIYIII